MDTEWESHKDVLRTLYFSKDPKDRKVGTLKWVMFRMKSLYGFDKSKGQYERHFKTWKFEKNSTSTHWDVVLWKKEKRKRQGKASAIYRAGRKIPEEKLNKEKRHLQSSILKLFDKTETPPTPQDFTISSPLGQIDTVPCLLVDNLPSLQLFSQFVPIVLTSGKTNFNSYNCASVRASQDIFHNSTQGDTTNIVRSLISTFIQGVMPFEQVYADFDLKPNDRLRDTYGLYTSGWARIESDPFEHLLQMQHGRNISQDLLRMIHLAANNMLDKFGARRVLAFPPDAKYRRLLIALVSMKAPAAKAVARTLLEGAIQARDLNLVKALLETGINPDGGTNYARDSDTPLRIAIRAKSIDMTVLLLQHGADVNRDAYIVDAAASGQVELVSLLLRVGADINAQSTRHCGKTALIIAAEANDFDMASYLVAHGATTNTTDALSAAIQRGNLDIVDSILCSAPIDPLDIAYVAISSCRGNPGFARYLLQCALKKGSSWDGLFGLRALRAAAATNDLELARDLLNAGFGVIATDFEGRREMTPLHDAAHEGHIEMIQLLLEFGADVNAVGERSGEPCTVLDQAIWGRHGASVVQILLHAGAVINNPLSDEGSLMLAALCGCDHEVMQLLLRAGQDIQGQLGPTLRLVSIRYSSELIRLVLDSCKTSNKTEMFSHVSPHGEGALETAAYCLEGTDALDIARLLIDHGAKDLSRALRTAASSGNLELMELLFTSGGDVNAEFSISDLDEPLDYFMLDEVNVTTAIESATRNGHIEAVQFLLDRGSTGIDAALQVAAHVKDLDLMRLFIDAGADVNAHPQARMDEPFGYMTALQAAAYNDCNIEALRLLFDAGADVDGQTSFEGSNPQIKHGFDATDHGLHMTSALAFAAIAGNICAVQELIIRGANVNAPAIYDDERMPLEGAAEHGRLDIVQLLLNVKAEIHGTRALEFAQEEGHDGVVQLLLEHILCAEYMK